MITPKLTRKQARALLSAANEGYADMQARDFDGPADDPDSLNEALTILRKLLYGKKGNSANAANVD